MNILTIQHNQYISNLYRSVLGPDILIPALESTIKYMLGYNMALMTDTPTPDHNDIEYIHDVLFDDDIVTLENITDNFAIIIGERLVVARIEVPYIVDITDVFFTLSEL